MESTSLLLYIVTIIIFGCLSLTVLAPSSFLDTASAISSITIKPRLNNSISVLTTTDAATYTIVTNTTTDLFTGKVTTSSEVHPKISTPPGHNNTNTGGGVITYTTWA